MAITGAQLFAIVSVKGAAGAVTALRGVSGAVNSTQSSLSKITTGSGQLALGLTRIGIAAGAAALGGLAVATKESIDFQDAFAGVRKTVQGSPEQLSALYKSLEQLSTRIPISFQDLASIAQEAGALGVPTGKVTAFSEAVARLTAATVGLDEGTASEAFGKLGTIFDLGDTPDGYERLGSALIELGNNAASTEPDIIDITQRFAAAGASAGLSAAQVLGWASAIGSLGQQPQAAGSALQQLFQRTARAIGLGDKALSAIAKTAGMTDKQFTKAFSKDASGAVEAFLAGLNKLPAAQQQVILKNAQLSNVRVDQGILQLSSHLDLLDRSLDQSSTAWDDNSALVSVSNERFDTLKNKLIELKNKGLVALADLGSGISPALGRVADRFGTFLDSHMGDFTRLGTEIGDAIDEIDWTKVEHGAETVYGLLKQGLDVLKQIPPEVDLTVAAFLGLNKLSGGLLGSGLANIASGTIGGLLGGLSKGVASKVPGLGRLVATPVYIVGAAPGVKLGGLGGAAGAGGKVGGVAGALGTAASVAAAALALYQVVQTQQDQNKSLGGQHQSNLSAIDQYLATNPSNADIAKHIAQIESTKSNPFNFAALNIGSFLGLSGLTDLNAEEAKLQQALAKGQTQIGEHSALGSSLVAAANAANAPLRGEHAGITAEEERTNLAPVVKVLDQLHVDFLAQRKTLSKATDPATILKSATSLTKDILKGVGNVKNTQSALQELKTAELKVTDPTAKRTLDKLITQVQTRLAGREQIAATLSKDTAILNSGHITNRQLSGVNADIQTLRSHGDTHAANELTKLEQIRAKKLQATVSLTSTTNIRLDGRTVAHDVVRWTKGGVGLA